MTKIARALAVVLTAALLMGTGALSARAEPSGVATITVTFATPDGVPALATLRGKGGSYATAKSPSGSTQAVTIPVAAGEYVVEVWPVLAGTKRYVGVPSLRSVQVASGRTTSTKVTYALSKGVQEAHVSSISTSSIALAWTVPPGTAVTVRRTEGEVAAVRQSDGVPVPAGITGLTDGNLKAGTRYNYSLWAKPGDSALGVDQANGPVVLTVGTVASSGAAPSYVVKPGTLLAKQSDLTAVTPTGDGVRITLASSVNTPAPGSAVVLPASTVLRGGYLGVVVGIASDGRTVDLKPGGLGDAFDYYDLAVADMAQLPVITVDDADGSATASPGAASEPQQSVDQTSQDLKKELARTARAKAKLSPTSSPSIAPETATSPSAAAVPDPTPECGTVKVNGTAIAFKPSFAVAGHFATKLDKYKVLGVNIPTGVALDAEAAVTVSGAMTAKAALNVSCGIKVPPLLVPLPGPAPISYYLKPTVKIGIESGIQVSNLGVALTLGYKAKGYIGFNGTSFFNGSVVSEANPLTPQIDAVNGGLKAQISAESLFGPGAGSSGGGVIVGLGGQIVPLDLDAKVVVPTVPGASPCLTLVAKLKTGIIASARAWLGAVDFKADIPIPGLHVTLDYPGSPWYFPSNCTAVVNPSDDVLGGGVTKVDDGVSGSTTQWGYLEGFAPGTRAWVLSTGLVAEAQGAPDFFASTALGNPGNAQLTAYSGYATFDAAAYNVTLIPAGSTLHVKYVFASEEYPEFVGSEYNDTMAVFVAGKNCAVVPGTTTPVTINSINDHTNESYYVDNSTGASGYNTSYDGLTKPLTCDVPVQPGVPVTVQIAVADASDAIFDSAVALLDKGIWSD